MLGEQLNSVESRSLLSAIDKMRELLHGEKITLPEIVVVGDQSVGKSSVLEAISGVQLPRAQNICTRCPLELRMKTTEDKEYAIIRGAVGSTTEKRFDDLTKIADEVTRLTVEIAGKGVNVSANPIYLTVYKRDILYDLTLIDLPGITRNALPGQAENIHQQILDLINKYIEPSTAIVLHVIPASVDFTTSESMKLAKVFDPSCERQLIGVSKIDKYDKGIAEKLQGRGLGSMELQLGCVAVLNRNQDEIDQNISFDEMKQREEQFFIDHKQAFEHLPDEFKGSKQLVKRLATIQQERIRSTFPDIIKRLRKQIAEKKAQLKKIPASMNTESECWTTFQSMINIYRESISDNVKGEYGQVASTDIINVPITSKNVKDDSDSDINFDVASVGSDEGLLSHEDEYHIANDYRRLKDRLKEVVIKQLNDVKEKLSERVLEILDTERRVFTLNHYYMDTINKLKEKNKEKNDDQQASIKASSTPMAKNSTNITAYIPVSNEAQAAYDIQIALHSYSKLKGQAMFTLWLLETNLFQIEYSIKDSLSFLSRLGGGKAYD
ncbi:unnamed protein product [Adineta steineri]|uniref:Dynamin-type G domain-containing protein n=3 Tax=Adineta steineri TaxID=433720 RepID=A0A819LE18_9BILA|nr:unnamed protein product [Adineta steineri]